MLAEAEADRTRSLAGGESQRVKALAEVEAEKAARLGVAQALAIEEQVRAYGGPRLQLTQQVMDRFAEAIEQARVDVVPKIVVSGQAGAGGGGTSSLFEALLAVLLFDRMKVDEKDAAAAPRDPEMQAYRDQIRSTVVASLKTPGNGSKE